MSTNVLLIEDNDHRRVTVLKYLLRSGFQVTPCSSIAEAEEVLQFVSHKDMAPAVVVMAAHLAHEGGECFRRALADRFAGIKWILFPFNRDLVWLAERFGYAGEDADRPVSGKKRGQFDLNVLLIESDDDFRTRIAERLLDCGDRVTPCRSVEEAVDALALVTSRSNEFHVIVSSGRALNFYLAAARKFPGIRWVLTSSPPAQPEPADARSRSVEFALDSASEWPSRSDDLG
jgi:CheY-like chemotaxis protein